MNIAVIGTGKLGATVGLRWISAGHDVTFGIRRSGATTSLIGDSPTATPEAAANANEVVLLAVPGAAVGELLISLGTTVARKILIDATNQLGAHPMHALAACRHLAPSAVTFRAFNSLGWEVFADPSFAGGRPDLLYCGPIGEQARVVEQLITDVGLHPVRLGDLERADLIDGWTRLYFALALGESMGRHLAFRLLSPSNHD
jgi:hypothetical protein